MKRWISLPISIVITLVLISIPLYQTSQGASDKPVLALEPKSIEVPHLGSEQAILVELAVYNVINLKEFHISLGYDPRVLEYYGGKIDKSFYITTGGWVGSELDGKLYKAFSGSGKMFTYVFKVIQEGSTEINLSAELIDESGSTIPHTDSGCVVKVLPLNEWIDAEYAKLRNEYINLTMNYETLNASYTYLKNKYDELNTNYKELNATYYTLKTNYDSLQSNYNYVKTSYDALKREYELINKLMYLFATTTIIFIATTIYFAKIKLKWSRK
jgi:hypothetical protein